MFLQRKIPLHSFLPYAAQASLLLWGFCTFACHAAEAQDLKPTPKSESQIIQTEPQPIQFGSSTAQFPTQETPTALSTLTLQQQRTLLSQGLVSSLLNGTLDGMNLRMAQDSDASAIPEAPPVTQETWQTWLIHHGKRWLHTLQGQWHALKHQDQTHVDEKILELLATELGLALIQDSNTENPQIISSPHTPDRLRTLLTADHALLDTWYELYQAMAHQQSIAQDNLLASEIENLFHPSNDRLDHKTKLIIYLTILPHLIEHAKNSNAQVTVRKLTEAQRTLTRLLGNSRHIISCRENASPIHAEITFSPALIIPNTHGSYQIHTRDVSHDRFPASRVSCQFVETQETEQSINDRMQQAMDDAQAALLTKDNDITIQAMHHLNQTIRQLAHEYGMNAAWNNHWNHAHTEQWLCQLQLITLQTLEQHRFAEMAALDRGIQQAFSGSTFYQRMTNLESCQNILPESDRSILKRLNDEYSSAYEWIVKNYAPKARKNFDKNFAKWTRKIKRNIALTRRLLAAWTFWSEGDYAKAAKYAGTEITKNKSRVVHPQLHSFDLVLKAIRGEAIPREDLETYIHVILLKTPAVVYQTLSEAYPWFDETQRAEVVEIISQYPPTQAPAAAAYFYLTYEQEFRKRLDASKRAAIAAWLETEVRSGESAAQTQARREQWFKDLKEANDSKGFQHLMQVIQKDWDELSPQSQEFWSNAAL